LLEESSFTTGFGIKCGSGYSFVSSIESKGFSLIVWLNGTLKTPSIIVVTLSPCLISNLP